MFSFVNEIKKIILSLILAYILTSIWKIITKVPKDFEENLNDALKTKDKKLILKAL